MDLLHTVAQRRRSYLLVLLTVGACSSVQENADPDAGDEPAVFDGDNGGPDAAADGAVRAPDAGTEEDASADAHAPIAEHIEQVAIGGGHKCALFSGGSVCCMGENHYGQLGAGFFDSGKADRNTAHEEPVPVLDLSDAVALALGDRHSCARTQAGVVTCWGDHSERQLASTTVPSTTCEQVINDAPSLWTPCTAAPLPTDLPVAVELTASMRKTCVRDAAGQVTCAGQPYPGTPEVQGASTVRVSSSVVCAVRSGMLECAGDEALYNHVLVLELGGVAALALGANHACALLEDGSLRCWGDNNVGQLGLGHIEIQSFVELAEPLNGVAEVVAGRAHTCARTVDGAVHCWGSNALGQTGAPRSPDLGGPAMSTNCGGAPCQTSPFLVQSLPKAIALAAAHEETCAITEGREVYCWGAPSPWAFESGLGGSTPRKLEMSCTRTD